MWPRLVPGKTYLASSFLPVRTGSLVVAFNPREPRDFVVKRVISIVDGTYVLDGMVGWSSRFAVGRQCILGRVFA
jgi:hypothetical protein